MMAATSATSLSHFNCPFVLSSFALPAFCPSLSPSPLFLEADLRLQLHKGKLSLIWPRSLDRLHSPQFSMLLKSPPVHLTPACVPHISPLACPGPSGLSVQCFLSFRTIQWALPLGSPPMSLASSCGLSLYPGPLQVGGADNPTWVQI